MKRSYRMIVLLAAMLAAVPLAAQSTREDERAAAAANSATRMPVIIPAGTPLTVAIDQDLSSDSVNDGQQVPFHLASDYSEFGHVLISSGTQSSGDGCRERCSPERRGKSRGSDGSGDVSARCRWDYGPVARHYESSRKEPARPGRSSWRSHAGNRRNQERDFRPSFRRERSLPSSQM